MKSLSPAINLISSLNRVLSHHLHAVGVQINYEVKILPHKSSLPREREKKKFLTSFESSESSP